MKLAMVFSVCLSIAVTASRPALADDNRAWRCTSTDPTKLDCTDSLLNLIEDLMILEWPGSWDIPMPGIPYSCKRILGGQGTHGGRIPWTLHMSGPLLSFLIGRHTASAALTNVSAEAVGLDGFGASDAGISYVFGEGSSLIPVEGGTTGVTDLGGIAGINASGSFWTHTFTLWVDSQDVGELCTVGYTGHRVLSGDPYQLDWTPAQSVFAEFIRNQFRQAARDAALGSP